jgi:hypothetical protein
MREKWKDEKPQMFLVLEMIENDAGESPYYSFPEYWSDHGMFWAQAFKLDFFMELSAELGKRYNLHEVVV